MSDEVLPTLEEAIRQSGEGWLIDWFTPPENAINSIRRRLHEVHHLARGRLGSNAPDLSEPDLLREYKRNPQRVRGFFQALGTSGSAEMLLMAWRVIQGMEVKTVEISYERQQFFTLRVTLESPYSEEDAPYLSSTIADFKLLGHLGIMAIDDAPVFEGFYPLRIRC